MSASTPLRVLLWRLWNHFSARRRRQFVLLLLLMFVASLAEVVSIGAIVPFLGVLTSPETVFSHPAAQPLVKALGLAAPGQLLLPLTLAFMAAACITGAMRLLLLYVSTRLSFAAGADLGMDIYHRTLYQPYSVHLARNSSEVINGIIVKTGVMNYGVLMPTLAAISSCLTLCAVLTALVAINPVVAVASFVGFGTMYGAIIHVTRRKLADNGARIARESTQVLKSLQEGLGGIRDVLVDGSQATYCQIYRNADLPLRRAQGSNQFIGVSPRWAMEALGLSLISGVAYMLAREPGGIASAIPVLGALALGAQRLLPVLQQGYAALTSVKSSRASLEDSLALLEQPLPDHAGLPDPVPLPFQRCIAIEDVSFRYAHDSSWVFRHLNFDIPKGSRVGFIGATGSGKSTLLDIVMGLLQPTEGRLKVDDQAITHANIRAWQVHIAHVPQAIYLSDISIEENIAFGVPKHLIDPGRVRFAARQAQISDLIESWPKKYRTVVGERGIRLSGGQRQRIGIARALYKQADVIIFDEATSALDNETERSVMQAIEGLSKNLTILIVAHRLTTLRGCSQIVELGTEGVLDSGSYERLIGRRSEVHEI